MRRNQRRPDRDKQDQYESGESNQRETALGEIRRDAFKRGFDAGLIIVCLFVVINLAVDILYSLLDPRVRLAEAQS